VLVCALIVQLTLYDIFIRRRISPLFFGGRWYSVGAVNPLLKVCNPALPSLSRGKTFATSWFQFKVPPAAIHYDVDVRDMLRCGEDYQDRDTLAGARDV
jgi:hypothetical protein